MLRATAVSHTLSLYLVEHVNLPVIIGKLVSVGVSVRRLKVRKLKPLRFQVTPQGGPGETPKSHLPCVYCAGRGAAEWLLAGSSLVSLYPAAHKALLCLHETWLIKDT